jgi:phospholipid transport system transporter-binding protein
MLVLPETVTVAEARDVLQMLIQTVRRDRGDALTIDASALKEFDTAAVAVLLECLRQAKAWGMRFVVKGAPAKLVELAALYGVAELLAIGGQGVAA